MRRAAPLVVAALAATGCSVSIDSTPTATPAPPIRVSSPSPRVTGAVELAGTTLVRLAARWPLPGFSGCGLYAPDAPRLVQSMHVSTGGSAHVTGPQPVVILTGRATVTLYPRAETAGRVRDTGERQRLSDGTRLYVPNTSDAHYADVLVQPSGDPCLVEVAGDTADDYSDAYGSLRRVAT